MPTTKAPFPDVSGLTLPCGHVAGEIIVTSIVYRKAKVALWAKDSVILRAAYTVQCRECGAQHRATSMWQLLDTYYQELKLANAFRPEGSIPVAIN